MSVNAHASYNLFGSGIHAMWEKCERRRRNSETTAVPQKPEHEQETLNQTKGRTKMCGRKENTAEREERTRTYNTQEDMKSQESRVLER